MPFATITQLPAQTLDGYRAVVDAARLAADPPDGMLLHLAGRSDDGLQIVTLWDSAAQHDRFVAERLHPALQCTGAARADGMREVEFEIDDLAVGPALAPSRS